MDYLFMLCGVLLSLISLTLIHFLFAVITNRNEDKKKPGLPPGSTGLPLIGETLEFLYNMWEGHPEKFFFTRMAKYSPEVFKTSLLGAPVVVLCSAVGTKMLFSDANKLVKPWKPDSIRKLLLEERLADLHEWKPAVVQFAKMENLRKLISKMDSVARQHLDAHRHDQIVVFKTVKLYTVALGCRTFMSVEDFDVVKGISPLLGTVKSGILSLPINLPGTAFNRAIKASKVLKKQIVRIVKEKRVESLSKQEDHRSYLSCVFDTPLSDKDIADTILALLIASTEMNGVITLTLMALSDHPDAYQKIYEENMEMAAKKAPGEALNWGDIQQLRFTWNVVREVMRMYPASPGVAREAATDFSYAGYRIPKGVKIILSTNTMHRDPRYFPNPETFDPSRFEGTGPAPYTYFPFGGGLNMCLGRIYSQMAMLTFIHNIVKRFKWEKVHLHEKVVMRPAPIPAKGFPIILHPHNTDGSQ